MSNCAKDIIKITDGMPEELKHSPKYDDYKLTMIYIPQTIKLMQLYICCLHIWLLKRRREGKRKRKGNKDL